MQRFVEKRPIIPERIRRVPPSFSWIDRRFIRERMIERLSSEEALLYFFLVSVSDGEGLSFYGDATIAGLLHLPQSVVETARGGLERSDLIAYRAPLYQVLALPERGERRAGGVARLKDLLAGEGLA